MAQVVFTASADADVAAIFEDLNRKAGKGAVVKYLASFRELYDKLKRFPDSGSPRPKLGAGVRIGIVPPYIVIYAHSEAEGVVRVLRIVYGRRRITGKMIGVMG